VQSENQRTKSPKHEGEGQERSKVKGKRIEARKDLKKGRSKFGEKAKNRAEDPNQGTIHIFQSRAD